MHAEVIAIGDELTSGQRLDTNSQWLSVRLGEIGIRVLYHSTVGDDLDACAQVFRNATQRAQIIVATGGLGPTADDLTRQAISQATDRELVLVEDALNHIRGMFERRKRSMPETNQVQAMFPQGTHVIPNPHGTAPGIDLSVELPGNRSRIFALPGVPAEMVEMWNESVHPRINAIPGRPAKVIMHQSLKCFGVGESACEQKMPDLIRRGRKPSVGITVHRGTITLRVTGEAATEEECRKQMRPTIETIHASLGSLVFGEEDDELQDVVMLRLRERNESVAVAEWGTAGLISSWLGVHRSTDRVFPGSVILDSPESVARLLAIEESLTQQATSKSLAIEMAKAVRERFQTTFGLSITAFPHENDEDQEFHVAIATSIDVDANTQIFLAHPDIARDVAAKHCLNLLRLKITA